MKKITFLMCFILTSLMFCACGGNTIVGTWLGDASFISEDGAETMDYYYCFYEDGTGKMGNDTLGYSEFTYTDNDGTLAISVGDRTVEMTYEVDAYTAVFTARGSSAEFKRVE